MSSVNVANNKVDSTVRIFDQFYNIDIEVPAAEYDIVNSFFLSVVKRKEAADAFTMEIFRVSATNGTPVLTLLDQIQDNDAVRLTANLCYYLNGIRSPCTLLGTSAVYLPNVNVARNILL